MSHGPVDGNCPCCALGQLRIQKAQPTWYKVKCDRCSYSTYRKTERS